MGKLKLILALFNRREKQQLILVAAALLGMGFIELVGVGSLGPFISVVSNPKVIHTNIWLKRLYELGRFESDGGFIAMTGILVIAMLVASNLCLGGANFLMYYYAAKRRHSIGVRLFEKYLRQPYCFYLTSSAAVLSKRVLGDVSAFIGGVLMNLLQLIASSIISLCIIILLIVINPALALAVSGVLTVSYLAIFAFVKDFLARKGRESNAQNALKFKYTTEGFNGIKDIKILGKEQVFLDSFTLPSRKNSMNEASRDIVNDLPKYVLETIAVGGIVGVMVIMIRFGAVIDDFLPVLTVYAFGAYRLLPLLQKVFRAFAGVRYSFAIVEELHHDFCELPEGEALAKDDPPRMAFHKEAALKDVVFRYPAGSHDIIKNQSLIIKANTSIALVGATGCGKTTLIDILLGLLEPQSGGLFIDGEAVTRENRRSWQRNLGYVPQSIYLTDDTIRRNIAFGIEPEKIDEEAVVKAACLANMHGFITSELEGGYDTVIGDRGIRLSGGQRQRIGIARAVYHDPPVLILDEATSALDSLTENAIIDAMKTMSGKKTLIMIAHRITTVKNCDQIYLMEKGVITDHGAYEELYQKNELFREMADGPPVQP
ncbi:MAG: ABC transporter ATP-binding protein/permease [Spirochaetaceae bacterium]|jgi:ABC-type multidrug transport system fused ATPase/permease subunit|nr:ABC transporter ATP-binding protein/permease [Spirochaetaceae bacterium]